MAGRGAHPRASRSSQRPSPRPRPCSNRAFLILHVAMRYARHAAFFRLCTSRTGHQVGRMNTEIRYEYRDAGNYRFHGSIIVAGKMTDALWQRMLSSQDSGAEGFIAHQVRIPEVFGFLPGPHIQESGYRGTGFPYDEEDDHCWHRLADGEEPWKVVEQKRTDRRSVLQLV